MLFSFYRKMGGVGLTIPLNKSTWISSGQLTRPHHRHLGLLHQAALLSGSPLLLLHSVAVLHLRMVLDFSRW
ncbi:hypothetical protein E2320_016352, partial [Naja naja]